MYCLYPNCEDKNQKFELVQGKNHVWECHLKCSKDQEKPLELEKKETEEMILSYLNDEVREHLYCTWPECKFFQYDKDRWKAKRHVWDKHLKETLGESLKKGKHQTNYGNLSKEEQKKVNEEVEKYIGTRLAVQKKRKRAEKVEEKVVPVIEQVIDHFTPRIGHKVWDPTKLSSVDVEKFVETVQKDVVVNTKVNQEKLYQIVHENNYDLKRSKVFIENNVSVVEQKSLKELDGDDTFCYKSSSDKKNSLMSATTYHLICEYIQIKKKKLF